MNDYFLVLQLDYDIKIFDSQLRIPFQAAEDVSAEMKAENICEIWKDSLITAQLYKLKKIHDFSVEGLEENNEI